MKRRAMIFVLVYYPARGRRKASIKCFQANAQERELDVIYVLKPPVVGEEANVIFDKFIEKRTLLKKVRSKHKKVSLD